MAGDAPIDRRCKVGRRLDAVGVSEGRNFCRPLDYSRSTTFEDCRERCTGAAQGRLVHGQRAVDILDGIIRKSRADGVRWSYLITAVFGGCPGAGATAED